MYKILPFFMIIVLSYVAGCQNDRPLENPLAKPCEPGTQLCMENDREYIYICNQDQTYIWEPCPQNTYCNMNIMACDAMISEDGSDDSGNDNGGENEENNSNKPTNCKNGERVCDGDMIKICIDGEYTFELCAQDEYCDADLVRCQPVHVDDEPGGCDPKTYEAHCYGQTLMVCKDGDVVSHLCGENEVCHAEKQKCEPVLEEKLPCQCEDTQYCDEDTGTCIDKACDNESVPKCVNGYALKFCDHWQYKIETCPSGYRCKSGQCYLPQTEPETPSDPPNDDGYAVDGINCDAGWISVSESEAKRCILDLNAKLEEDEYYCKLGRESGRYCRLVPDETGDARIAVQSGQYCTPEQLKPGTDTLRVHIIDVGQGDAIWIQTPTGQNVLIDGGEGGAFGATSAGPIVRDYLTFHGFKPGSQFNAVFLTHPHSDHYGGLPNIFNHYGMKNYIDPMALNTEEDVPSGYINWIKKVEGLVDSNNIYMPAEEKFKTTAKMPTKFFGSDVSAYYITSSQKLTNDKGKDQNENRASLIFQLNYAGRSFLFTGDAEAEQEAKAVAASPKRVSSNFLKVCHHGSTTSTTTSFLDAVWQNIAKSERAAFISSGRKSFGGTTIPAASVVNRLTENYLELSQLYATSVGDDQKSESEAYRDDNILIVVHADGSYYACYAGPN